ALEPPTDPLQCHRPSECRLDAATAARGDWIAGPIQIPPSRSRQYLCDAPRRVDRKARGQGAKITAAQSDRECDLRKSRRHHPPRVPGLTDSTIGIAFTVDSEIVDSPLQYGAPTYGLG